MIQITPIAIAQIKKQITARNTPQVCLRLGIKGGDCNGFSYVIQFDDNDPKERDLMLEIEGIKVVIDKKSALYLENAILNYKATLMEQGFFFTNPQEKSRCSCGKSFSI